MKILFFHRWVGVHAGGSETHILELANRFLGLGHEISILTREGQRLVDLDKRIRVIRISRNFRESDHSYDDIRVYLHTGLYMCKAFLKLISLALKGRRFDIISVHFATEALLAKIFRVFTKTPFIFILEGYTPLEAKTAKSANACVAISQYEASIYRERHGLECEVIPVGVDLNKFLPLPDENSSLRKSLAGEGQVIILSVCRLEPRKDIFTLIKAAKLMRLNRQKIKFVIVGEGISRKDIEDKIKEEGVSEYIHLAGFIPDSDLPLYYAASDIFLLTSKEEWFGIVFLEAMASGLPIITTRLAVSLEVVGNCGLFFDKGDFRQLADMVSKLASDQSLRKELAESSRTRAREFDWNKQILFYEKAYLSTLANKNV